MNQEIKQIVETLPVAARKWLRRTLPEDYKLPGSITIKQDGEMEIRGRWTPFKAEGIYKSPPLSFNWEARLKMMSGVWIVAVDGHAGGQGWGGAKMWGLVPMGKRTDPEVLATQVVRNIAEMPWFPTLALLDLNLRWSDASTNEFEVATTAGSANVHVRFEVNQQGDITRAYSPARPYDVSGGYEEAPWSLQFDDHRQYGDVRIPSMVVATYHKKDGDWEYLRAKVVEIIHETTE